MLNDEQDNRFSVLQWASFVVFGFDDAWRKDEQRIVDEQRSDEQRTVDELGSSSSALNDIVSNDVSLAELEFVLVDKDHVHLLKRDNLTRQFASLADFKKFLQDVKQAHASGGTSGTIALGMSPMRYARDGTVGIEFVFRQSSLSPNYVILHTHHAGSYADFERDATKRGSGGQLIYPNWIDVPALDRVTSINVRHSTDSGLIGRWAVEKLFLMEKEAAELSNGAGKAGNTFRIVPRNAVWKWRECARGRPGPPCQRPMWSDLIADAMLGHPDLLQEPSVAAETSIIRGAVTSNDVGTSPTECLALVLGFLWQGLSHCVDSPGS